MVCHVCRGSGIFRRRMESLFYTRLPSLCILLTALFLPYSLLTREKMPGAQQIKFLKTCSALGMTLQPLGPSPLLFSVASLSLAWCHIIRKLLDSQGLCEVACAVFHGKGWFSAWEMLLPLKLLRFPSAGTKSSVSLLPGHLQSPSAKHRANRKNKSTWAILLLQF